MQQATQMKTWKKRSFIIALALGQVLEVTKEIPIQQAMDEMETENKVMGEIYQNKNWKEPLSHTFTFKETEKAQLFASAILNSHGAEPEIRIYPDGYIMVSTPGYQC